MLIHGDGLLDGGAIVGTGNGGVIDFHRSSERAVIVDPLCVPGEEADAARGANHALEVVGLRFERVDVRSLVARYSLISSSFS